jgi:hypothetical protein
VFAARYRVDASAPFGAPRSRIDVGAARSGAREVACDRRTDACRLDRRRRRDLRRDPGNGRAPVRILDTPLLAPLVAELGEQIKN